MEYKTTSPNIWIETRSFYLRQTLERLINGWMISKNRSPAFMKEADRRVEGKIAVHREPQEAENANLQFVRLDLGKHIAQKLRNRSSWIWLLHAYTASPLSTGTPTRLSAASLGQLFFLLFLLLSRNSSSVATSSTFSLPLLFLLPLSFLVLPPLFPLSCYSASILSPWLSLLLFPFSSSSSSSYFPPELSLLSLLLLLFPSCASSSSSQPSRSPRRCSNVNDRARPRGEVPSRGLSAARCGWNRGSLSLVLHDNRLPARLPPTPSQRSNAFKKSVIKWNVHFRQEKVNRGQHSYFVRIS